MSDIGTLSLKARDWAVEKALPLWSGAGFDERWGGFHERLDLAGAPITDVPRRLMVQARQIYVYTHADLLGWWPDREGRLDRAVATLIEKFHRADGEPGFVHSVFADGRVADATRDTYAHAFALFALGWSLRRRKDASLLSVVEETLSVLDRKLACAGGGGFETGAPLKSRERLQNPHMHLFEAFLALYEGTGDGKFLARAGEIYGLSQTRFLRGSPVILGEYYDETWQPAAGARGGLWEPGHHFEWAWLMRRYGTLAGRDASGPARALYETAWTYGRNPAGFVVDECDASATPTKRSLRAWPHTEGIKAAAAEHEARAGAAGSPYAEHAAELLEKVTSLFLRVSCPGGWMDQYDENLKGLVPYMPASSLYHVFQAIAEANRAFAP